MTHPSDPGHSPRPPASGPPGGPYGPPPQQQQPGPVPGPRPGYGTGPYEQPQPWQPPPHDPQQKNLLGALFDTNFDHMVTTQMIKIVYRLALVLITLFALLVAWYGVAFLEWNTTLGLLTLIATPFLWVSQLLTTRMVLEFLINQFKISEYLRAIKDKD
ncbi:DUF4282 domain-containing protein [Actinomadura opuntiae]|uniref:DUF4282 domain-containing protein n=1 Tax=Actinomadura sp. OS1-43 TaxID=604315 RepID=UPI00255AAC01|nr:DUF4282 domain-containing protein [Actinomadura sp. OS1-43]MDL4819635.1 DUF4282 domain-containing protein [Actinomadura sp. OS1-43]